MITLSTPHSPVVQTFESEDRARRIWALNGVADSVFVLPEATFIAELELQLQTLPVLVYRTMTDFNGAILHQKQIPWLVRVIRYGTAAHGDPGSGFPS